MQQKSVILRFADVAQQKHLLNKLVGNVPLSSFADLITAADLDANPRAAKRGPVTDDVEDSLENESDIFHFMTKGVLVAARKVDELERNRFRLTFEEPALEGILDGGHITLATGRFVLRRVLAEVLGGDDEAASVVKTVKRWEDLKSTWEQYAAEVQQHKSALSEILIPIEVIYPSDSVEGEAYFQDKILRINSARNNNAQLTEETKANKKGYYDPIKANLDPALCDQVEWKTNDGGRIKVRDLVALALIPLAKLEFKELKQVTDSPSVIFSSKGQCVGFYNDLMDIEGVTENVKGDIVVVKHEGVLSALKLMKDLPHLFDVLYQRLPDAYNSASPGFGRIRGVRLYAGPEKHKENKEKYLRNQPVTRYYQSETKFSYGEGFMYPLFYGLSAILELKDGKVAWMTDPEQFIDAHLTNVMRSFQSMIAGQGYDPAKLGKSSGAYNLAFEMFKSAYRDDLLKRLMPAEDAKSVA